MATKETHTIDLFTFFPHCSAQSKRIDWIKEIRVSLMDFCKSVSKREKKYKLNYVSAHLKTTEFDQSAAQFDESFNKV